ncbi:L-rhamnose mutarotase [Paenibacillus sp. HB172176]|uniref:L-rhamnose mutarotase n=1 Tax=Paenibacillus sp. HB172176 TaxID=2493690 RepID=UPI00143C9C8A|nr:L-rhamnose mutarotase [Paenibacillus sp. HB172176]
MEHVSFVLKIDQQEMEEYKRRHNRVDPELEEQFEAAGIHRYHIFLHEGTLFAYMEVENFEQAMKHLADHPANLKWQAFMSDMLQAWEDGSMQKQIPEMYRFERKG